MQALYALKNKPFTKLRFLIILVLLISIFFRFANLERKVYWHDETYTSLWISGHSLEEVAKGAFSGRVITIEDLQKYQRINSDRGIIDTVKWLAKEDYRHPPLYYIIARLWVQLFGDSVTGIRSLSAFISLLVFPCVYWLCLELFNSSLTGWMTVAIVAVSPFYLLYAQEAREYSLWTVVIVLSSAVLLRAIKQSNKLNWATYTITLCLALYSHSISILVLLAHGIYVLTIERFRLSKIFIAYLVSSLLGFLSFVPWLMNFRELNGPAWTTEKVSSFFLVRNWAGNLARIFFDFYHNSSDPLIVTVPPIAITWILTGYSIYFICRNAPKKIWVFVLTLGGVNLLALLLPDLMFGGQRSAVSRYLIPCYLSVQLSVSFLLSTQISSARSSQRKVWQIITAVLVSIGVISGAIISFKATSWNKEMSNYNLQVANIINQTNRPLLISSTDYYLNPGEIFCLSYLLEPKVRLQLVVKPTIPKIPNNYTDVFVFHPSKELRKGLEKQQKIKVKLVDPIGGLWRLEK